MMASLDGRLVLPPYRRMTPPEYVCAECGATATGYTSTRGVVMFSCPDHTERVIDAIEAITSSEGSTGRARLRHSWDYWLNSRRWLVRNAIRAALLPSVRSERRKEQELLARTAEGSWMLPGRPYGLRR